MPSENQTSNLKTPQALCVIPARFASTRLPGKPLLAETGTPLIVHVIENAQKAQRVGRAVVATDDPRIQAAVEKAGFAAVMTGEHPNGTSRIAEAVTKIEAGNSRLPDDALIVNVQGDEPEVDPTVIDALIEGLSQDAVAPMATLCARFAPDEDTQNPNIVKLVKNRLNHALYFSRSPIPFNRDDDHQPVVFKHPGLYAYRRGFLRQYPALEPTPLENTEKLEQLRVLEHGHRIAVIEAQAPEPGIDTPEQYAAFVARYQNKTS